MQEIILKRKSEICEEMRSRESALEALDTNHQDRMKFLESRISELRAEAVVKVRILDSIVHSRDEATAETKKVVSRRISEIEAWRLKTERLLSEFAGVQRRITDKLFAEVNLSTFVPK